MPLDVRRYVIASGSGAAHINGGPSRNNRSGVRDPARLYRKSQMEYTRAGPGAEACDTSVGRASNIEQGRDRRTQHQRVVVQASPWQETRRGEHARETERAPEHACPCLRRRSARPLQSWRGLWTSRRSGITHGAETRIRRRILEKRHARAVILRCRCSILYFQLYTAFST